MMEKSIGVIGNFYGGLLVKKDGDKFFWSIEDDDGHIWQEIPESLYKALIEFEESGND